ncbi:MAG: GNAT family N-acetyltransferase [Bacillota bacterium]|nr:GNAT family N-acetyltransferase [Bacillota bacterium]
MLDRSIPYIGVLMEKFDTDNYPVYLLPAGYSFCLYRQGLEEDWCRLQLESKQVDSLEAAQRIFADEFVIRPDLLARQCFFVSDDRTNEIVGTASLWTGSHFGEERHRLHWVTVDTRYQGKGLAKALLTRVFDCYNEQDYSGYIYLTSQTWSYKALNLYASFGFLPYFGPKPANWKSTEDFARETETAWKLIRQKIDAYTRQAKSDI